MIIFGYPGIGKTTTAAKDSNLIDLESSNFMNDKGERSPDWYIYYAKVADNLSKQGYTVLAACHKEIRVYLADEMHTTEPMAAIFPDPELKEEWIKKLKERYEKSGSTPNKKALDRVRDNLDGDVNQARLYEELLGIHLVTITSMNYCLSDIIQELKTNERYW